MKNKKTFTFLTTVLTAALLLGACNSGPSSNSTNADSSNNENGSSVGSLSCSCDEGDSSSSASSQANTYMVTFVVDGKTIQTSQVAEGDVAAYVGDTPAKENDPQSRSYRFVGWDKDISQPITANTVFNAVFEQVEYADEIVVDDFESYKNTGRMKEAGWKVLAYTNDQWTENTQAAILLSTNSEEGEQSLRLNAWENGTGYKFVKETPQGAFTKSANALRFRLMVPAINKVKVLLKGKVDIGGTTQAPSFSYEIQPQSGEYVEYTLPLSDENWILWDDATKSMHSVAGWMGVHEDDYLKYLTSIDFFIQGNDASYQGNGWPYAAFLDSVRFVTVDTNEAVRKEKIELYETYSAKLANDNTGLIAINDNNTAMFSLDKNGLSQGVLGTYTVTGNEFKFVSTDQSKPFEYTGKLTNGGKYMEYVSATDDVAVLEGIRYTAIQTVDNFESYAEDGISYNIGDNPATKEERRGCRGAYYSEYYSGSNSDEADWGKKGWSLMRAKGDQLKLVQDGSFAKQGNNCLSLKHSRTNAMRYMQWGIFDGTAEKQAFRGEKFSFWAKTDGLVKKFKVYMYSQSAPTLQTRDNYVKTAEFVNDSALSNWTHYEIDINPNIVYYGFMVLIENNYGLPESEPQHFLFLDNI